MGEPIFIDYDIGFDNIIFILSAVFMKNITLNSINLNISGDAKVKDVNNIVNMVKLSKSNINLTFGENIPIINSNKVLNKANKEILRLIKEFGYELQNSPEIMIRDLKNSREKVNFISTGSLSNIAKMFLVCPEIKEKINKIIVVGGAMYGGNCTPCAEKNIFQDAYAADIVFNSGVPISMCGLDVTEKAQLSGSEIDDLLNCIKSSANKYITENFKDELICFFENLKANNKPLANLCGIIFAINPEIFKFEKCMVSIETGGEFTHGCTVVDINHVLEKPRNVEVVYSLDVVKFVSILKEFLIDM